MPFKESQIYSMGQGNSYRYTFNWKLEIEK